MTVETQDATNDIELRLRSLNMASISSAMESNEIRRWKLTSAMLLAALEYSDHESAIHIVDELGLRGLLQEFTPNVIPDRQF